MVFTDDRILAEAERFAHGLSGRFGVGGAAWTDAVTLWANAQPVRARIGMRLAYWRQTHGQMTGRPALSPEVIAVLTVAERAWSQEQLQRAPLAG